MSGPCSSSPHVLQEEDEEYDYYYYEDLPPERYPKDETSGKRQPLLGPSPVGPGGGPLPIPIPLPPPSKSSRPSASSEQGETAFEEWDLRGDHEGPTSADQYFPSSTSTTPRATQSPPSPSPKTSVRPQSYESNRSTFRPKPTPEPKKKIQTAQHFSVFGSSVPSIGSGSVGDKNPHEIRHESFRLAPQQLQHESVKVRQPSPQKSVELTRTRGHAISTARPILSSQNPRQVVSPHPWLQPPGNSPPRSQPSKSQSSKKSGSNQRRPAAYYDDDYDYDYYYNYGESPTGASTAAPSTPTNSKTQSSFATHQNRKNPNPKTGPNRNRRPPSGLDSFFPSSFDDNRQGFQGRPRSLFSSVETVRNDDISDHLTAVPLEQNSTNTGTPNPFLGPELPEIGPTARQAEPRHLPLQAPQPDPRLGQPGTSRSYSYSYGSYDPQSKSFSSRSGVSVSVSHSTGSKSPNVDVVKSALGEEPNPSAEVPSIVPILSAISSSSSSTSSILTKKPLVILEREIHHLPKEDDLKEAATGLHSPVASASPSVAESNTESPSFRIGRSQNTASSAFKPSDYTPDDVAYLDQHVFGTKTIITVKKSQSSSSVHRLRPNHSTLSR